MGKRSSTKVLSHKDVWKRIADVKLEEFEEFRKQGRYLTAVYLAGYSVEAYLKRSICLRMDLDELPGIFMSHDLKLLLQYSGLSKRILTNPKVYEYFELFAGVWNSELRYEDPAANKIGKPSCDHIYDYLMDNKDGIIPFLRAETK